MPDWPDVSRCRRTNGASAVPDPVRATTGSAIANSVTPPVVKVSGFAWFAFTSTTPAGESPGSTAGSVIVCGSVPVAPVRPSPR